MLLMSLVLLKSLVGPSTFTYCHEGERVAGLENAYGGELGAECMQQWRCVELGAMALCAHDLAGYADLMHSFQIRWRLCGGLA